MNWRPGAMYEKVDAGFSRKHRENKGIWSLLRFNQIALDSSERNHRAPPVGGKFN
jgi:hypothetical protein